MILVSTIVTNRLINITVLRKKRVSAIVVNCKSMNSLTNSVGSMLLSSTKRIGLIPEQHCDCVNTYLIPTVIKSIVYYRFHAFCMYKVKYNTAIAISNIWLWVNFKREVELLRWPSWWDPIPGPGNVHHVKNNFSKL